MSARISSGSSGFFTHCCLSLVQTVMADLSFTTALADSSFSISSKMLSPETNCDTCWMTALHTWRRSVTSRGSSL